MDKDAWLIAWQRAYPIILRRDSLVWVEFYLSGVYGGTVPKALSGLTSLSTPFSSIDIDSQYQQIPLTELGFPSRVDIWNELGRYLVVNVLIDPPPQLATIPEWWSALGDVIRSLIVAGGFDMVTMCEEGAVRDHQWPERYPGVVVLWTSRREIAQH